MEEIKQNISETRRGMKREQEQTTFSPISSRLNCGGKETNSPV
jgi:ribosomal protein L32